MNGLDVRVSPHNLVLKHCRIHGVQLDFGSIRCCINVVNEHAFGGTFLLFKPLSEQAPGTLLSGKAYITLLSEHRGVIGVGDSDELELSTNLSALHPTDPLPQTFTLLSGIDTEIPLTYKTSGKPDIDLGSIRLALRLYSLVLVKECPHTSTSFSTDKESLEILEDTELISETSKISTEEDSESDTSLNNFLLSLQARNAKKPTEKLSHSTQTAGGIIKKPHSAPVVRRSIDADDKAIAIMAPNPYLRPSLEREFYALTEYFDPEPPDVVEPLRESLRGLHHPQVVYDARSRPLAHPRRPPHRPHTARAATLNRTGTGATAGTTRRRTPPVSAPKAPQPERRPLSAPKTEVAAVPKVSKGPHQRAWH